MRNSDGMNISAWSSSSAGRKPASKASATEGATAEWCGRRGVAAIRVQPTFTCSGKVLRHHQKSGPLWGCIFLHICHISMHFIFKVFFYAYSVTWTWIYRQRRGCSESAYFASYWHTLFWQKLTLFLRDALVCFTGDGNFGKVLN